MHGGPKLIFHQNCHIAAGGVAVLTVDNVTRLLSTATFCEKLASTAIGEVGDRMQSINCGEGRDECSVVFNSCSTFRAWKFGRKYGRFLQEGDIILFILPSILPL